MPKSPLALCGLAGALSVSQETDQLCHRPGQVVGHVGDLLETGGQPLRRDQGVAILLNRLALRLVAVRHVPELPGDGLVTAFFLNHRLAQFAVFRHAEMLVLVSLAEQVHRTIVRQWPPGFALQQVRLAAFEKAEGDQQLLRRLPADADLAAAILLERSKPPLDKALAATDPGQPFTEFNPG